MNLKKLIFTISVAMAIAILALTTFDSTRKEVLITRPDESKTFDKMKKEQALSVKRVSRFLVQDNPRAEFHCNKDNRVCYAEGSAGSTCCNNKCVDLETDSNNCGACKNMCKFTESCCNGDCVNLYYDKRNCGRCNNKCMPGGYCIYGMCDYA